MKKSTDEVGAWIRYASQLVERGDYLQRQHRFEEAKAAFVQAADSYMNVLKMITKEDRLVPEIKQSLVSTLNKAETCKKQVDKTFKSTGYGDAQKFLSDIFAQQKTGASPRAAIGPKDDSEDEEDESAGKEEKKEKTGRHGGQFLLEKDKIKVSWDDIKGLDETKKKIQETIILPSLNPKLFEGIRNPSSGILLYGPPGTGKTMIAKAIASECQSNFYSVSASSLLSKWVGESEKNLKDLFDSARSNSPAVVFFDEVDSILQKRGGANENEASRRLKTEFLTQFDGVQSDQKNVLILGATNRPFDLDEAAMRRFTSRVYIGLPDYEARKALLLHLLNKGVKYNLNDEDLQKVVEMADGYSCADLASIVREVSWIPIRELEPEVVKTMKPEDLRALEIKDFEKVYEENPPTVGKATLLQFEVWEKMIRNK